MRFAGKSAATGSGLSNMSTAYAQVGGFGATPISPGAAQAMNAQGMSLADTPFAPGIPINPRREAGSSPVQWEYIVGQNIIQLPRTNEAISFETIDRVLSGYDAAKLCRKVRIDQARTMSWNILPNDPSEFKKYKSDILEVTDFFEHPYSGVQFGDFLAQVENDRITYDAMCFFKRYSKGGKLVALEPVDGRTITPIIDFYGHRPVSPAPAFVQFVRGYPEVWLTRDALVYRPFYPRNGSAYGTSPIETVLLNANTEERFWLSSLQYYTQGDVPDTFVEMPPDMDSNGMATWWHQIEDFLKGVQEYKHMVYPLPAGSKPVQMRPYQFNSEQAMHLLSITCAAFDVVPSEIGFVQNVSKSMGNSLENVQARRSQKPTLKYYNDIFTDIIRHDLKKPFLHFELAINNKDEDQLMDAQRHQILVNAGIESREDAHIYLYGHAPTDGIEVGRTITTANQILRVQDVANGTMGQGESTSAPAPAPVQPPVQPQKVQKSAPRFANSKEDALARNFSKALAVELSRQADACAQIFQTPVRKADQSPSEGEGLYRLAVLLNMIDTPEFNGALKSTLETYIVQAFELSATENAQGVELLPQTSPAGVPLTAQEIFHNAANDYASAHVGELITSLDDTTKATLQSHLRQYIEQGMTPQQIADAIQKSYAFSDSRAMTIARSETADAWNMGAIVSGEAAGHNAVRVTDGDHDEACIAANGQVWSNSYAKSHLKQHPNCVRDMISCKVEPEEIDRGDDYE